MNVTATERVKTLAAHTQLLDLRELREFMDAKGFDLDIVSHLSQRQIFARLFGELVLRTLNEDDILNQYGEALKEIDPTKNTEAYVGSSAQNRRIDSAVANSGISNGSRRFGEGAATQFSTSASIPNEITSVPIAVIGYGAAGIIATYALRALGFSNITVYEKSRPLGVWGNENVAGQSRNNPFRLEFFDNELDPAPGGGLEVQRFLEELSIVRPKTATIESIIPKELNHRILFKDQTYKNYPIVINAIGLGKPKPVSDPTRMVTETGHQHAGMRWQHAINKDKVNGSMIIMIGLGNSTAEMLRQIHALSDQGYDIDYRVLTHYPEESVMNPARYVEGKGKDGKLFRVFRDISVPNLVDYQGDLPLSRYDYFRALHGGKIVSDVTRWEVHKVGTMSVYRATADQRSFQNIPYDRVMTLIGYQQPSTVMMEMGCKYDKANQCGAFDYDGELIAVPGEAKAGKRLHKGCFGFGAVLESPDDRNAIVLPGMLHRLGDLIFGVTMRASEVRKKELMRR